MQFLHKLHKTALKVVLSFETSFMENLYSRESFPEIFCFREPRLQKFYFKGFDNHIMTRGVKEILRFIIFSAIFRYFLVKFSRSTYVAVIAYIFPFCQHVHSIRSLFAPCHCLGYHALIFDIEYSFVLSTNNTDSSSRLRLMFVKKDAGLK